MRAGSARFSFAKTSLQGLVVLEGRRAGDERGYLQRLYCADELEAIGMQPVVQINHTLTGERGSVRGMHFQFAPHSEEKLVTCLVGKVFDVAVDLRAGSPTFLRWHATVLDADEAVSVFIPEGFAHGFQVLSDTAQLVYLHSAAYQPEAEGGVHPQDPRIAIDWPLPPINLSRRDQSHDWLDETFTGLTL